ncbi:hypothetical protein IU459_36705 [Nocardia amamiensis]|uniref:Ferrochelatase n=1 Tax=Nocardia amamiensis TaxID=404578 RepID=A0ABS0D2E0_9NOCA|nr:hypothetical protein [Nocardia amamiensis]MBF6303008.1 hypothetical protein [Nocardia amamiensis]
MLRAALDRRVCELASAYLRLKAEIGEMSLGDGQLARSYASYGDVLMEVMLADLQPQIEKFLGTAVLPTHSYARLYRRSDELKRHTDRLACEVAVSLTLGRDTDVLWPLYVQGTGSALRFDLDPGDCVVYAGSRCNHWRDPFDGEWQAQATWHYVRAEGQHVEWAFDKRPALGRHVGTRRL